MPLTSGARLGGYEITAPLGAGGMGEVYRARDASLDREVAIKVLPEAMARDVERVARFEREARLLASLSHPNIAAIHGFDQSNGQRFLVLEFVEGETLATRLARGPLTIEDAIDVGRQVAEGLEAAHEKGVIHRDLKPGNVMIRPDGTVKVLDFGLAKAMSDDTSGTALANSPTITANYTKPGVVLGTAAYMSPEQARGRAVDARTDIWSLGVLLYEALSGESLFRGDTATDSIGAILHKDIALDYLPPTTPNAVKRLLRRCLERDKRRRLQAAGDARIELEEIARQLESGVVWDSDSRAERRRLWAWPALSSLLAVALVVSLLRSAATGPQLTSSETGGPVVTQLLQLTNLPGMQTDPAISPDGRMLLFVAREGQDWDIFLQRIGGENAINLTADSPADDYDPAFSPDGQQIAFRSQREGGGLFVMGATGESPRRIADEGFDPAWSPDGQELAYTTEDVEGPYTRSSVASLWIVDLRTRETRRLTEHDAVAPSWSPSGELVTFWAAIAGVRDIFMIPAAGGDPRPVTQDVATDWNPFFSPNGRTLYFVSDRSGTPDLWRVPIDPNSGEVVGAMRPVTAGVTAIDQATIAADGEHIAFMAPLLMSHIERYAFDPDTEQVTGEAETIYASTSVLRQFDVTADGRKLVFRTDAPREDLVVMNLDGTGRRRLMDDTHKDRGPRWTPDGQWLLFYSNRGGLYDIWRIRPDGTGMLRLTATKGHDLTDAVISPDSRLLATSGSVASGSTTSFFDLGRPVSSIDVPLSVPEPTVDGFVPRRFAPSGARLAGSSSFATLLVYDLGRRELATPRAPDGGDIRLSQDSGADWIDDNRLLTWDEKRGTAFVCNVDTGTARELPGLQGPSDIRVVEGGRTVVVNRLRAESDIWMLRLDRLGRGAEAALQTQPRP